MPDHKTIYHKDQFEKEIQKQFDINLVNYGTAGYGYIDDDYMKVLDCIIKAFEITTDSKIE